MSDLVYIRKGFELKVLNQKMMLVMAYYNKKKPRFLLALFMLIRAWVILVNPGRQILVETIYSMVFCRNVV